MQIQVKCYAGWRGEETPRTLVLPDREVFVKSIEKRWRTPDFRYFKVLAADGRTYRLKYDGQQWELI